MARTLHVSPALLVAAALALPPAATAQMHRVARPETVTRAVAVYEYAGELAKPTAARLIPVSLFIGGHFEDADSYLARPIPFALDPGTIYELERGGQPLGTLDLAFAKNLRGNSGEVNVPFDEAWFGYGKFAAIKAPVLATTKNPRHTQHAYAVQDDGKPHFGSAPAGSTVPHDSRDTTDVDPAAERAEKVSLPDDDRDPKAPDADRPTLRRRPEDTTGGPKTKRPKETASVTAAGSGPDRDPDRPIMKRKAGGDTDDEIAPDPSEVSSTKSLQGSAGTVSAAKDAAANGVLTDNGRPELRRNTGASSANLATEQASSMPDMQKVAAPAASPDLKMVVAVSDPKNRPTHDYSTPFASEAERIAALADMRALALAVLAKPELATDAIVGPQHNAVSPQKVVKHPVMSTGKAGRPTARPLKRLQPTQPAPIVTDNEQLSAFTLSYGAPLTYVYTAQAGIAPVRYVTVVAQRNLDGKLDISMRSVTDNAHLDRIPRYRFIDAVDADASNRADLLFELRNQASRQFALYRFLGAKPDMVFETATVK